MKHQAVIHQRSRIPNFVEPDVLNLISIKTSTSKYGSSASAGIDIPIIAAPGDLLIALIGSNYTVNSPPSGWIIVSKTSASWHNFAILSKTCITGDAGTTVTASMGGNEPWNSICIDLAVGSNIAIKSFGTKQISTNATTLTTQSVYASFGNLIIYGGSVRVGSKTTYFDAGTELIKRSSDASNSSACWYDEAALPSIVTRTFTSPSAATMSNGIVVIGE